MTLKYPADWKFEGIGEEIPREAVSEFLKLIQKTAMGTPNPQSVYETFKNAFGDQSPSSSASWAESDLSRAIYSERENAPAFVASLWSGFENAKRDGVAIPSVERINAILEEWDVPLVIDGTQLRMKDGDINFSSQADAAESNSVIYERKKEIGRGGFGVVYHVTRSTKAGVFDFAMKVLDPSSFVENKERAMVRFKREMQALRTLQHRGIVTYIEAGIDPDQRPYILMPMIEGEDLRDALSGAKTSEVFIAFDEILNALEYAHSKKVLHRDLKPSNILVRTSDNQPIILDFGSAYLLEDADEASLTTTLIGTASYMPSEVIRNPKHRTVKQDIYACGVLLYEILKGHHPDPDNYRPLRKLHPQYDGLDDLVREALAPERTRIESASVMRERLKAIAAQ